jgi:hypothetical protein
MGGGGEGQPVNETRRHSGFYIFFLNVLQLVLEKT